MPDTVSLKLIGRKAPATLPALLRSTARGDGAGSADPFLPPGYLKPRASFDVGAVARSTEGAVEQAHASATGEVLVIELADGSTLITTADSLKASLAQTRPELIGPNGEILFERLRAEGTASRGFVGEAIGGLVSRVFAIGVGEARDAIIDAAQAKLGNIDDLGVTWAGTRALMWAIESKLDREPGLYHWTGTSREPRDLEPADVDELANATAKQRPVLVFVHGTGSSSLGSFGDLQSGERDVWAALERHYSGGVFAFEHRTLSESPIENALQLARALPAGTRLSLVSHSRGGLVADLMCLGDFEPLIDRFESELPGTGDADKAEAKRVLGELGTAHAEHRALLRDLAVELRTKQFVIQRYVRVASPAQGTRLASGNFDLFLSGLLTLIGQVPFFFGNPLYSAFKRVVLEIVKNRTNPHLVPGIEAMLPDSPMASFLRAAPVVPGIEMAVIAGDIEGGNLLKRFGLLLTDFLLFDNTDNDLVVDTAAMLAGIAPQAGSRALFDRGAEVSHFNYFTNADTRGALRDWLVAPEVAALKTFSPLPGRFEEMDALVEAAQLRSIASQRGSAAADLPVVVVLPGVMGSHLWVRTGPRDASGVAPPRRSPVGLGRPGDDRGDDRVWFDPADIALGGLDKIAWGQDGVEAEKLFSMFYGKLCEHLAASHRVEAFPYDWRQPLDVLGERLGEFLDRLLKQTAQPVRLLAHSMGGLVVRACIHKRRSVMDQLMQRDGARFVMLGTPNQGAYSMVENLLGKGSTLRTLVRLDVKHDMAQVLAIVSGFRGALQLLPKPGFVDIFEGEPEGGQRYDLHDAATWKAFQPKVRDLWFGDGQSATPAQDVLDAAKWLWLQDGLARPSLPAEYETRSAYVFGVARNTPCGVREQDGRLKMVGTTRGDGTVSWESGRIDHVGRFYYLPAEHGDLPSTGEYFPALSELLATGATRGLSSSPPAERAIEQPLPITYDAGPPTTDGGEALARGLMGGRPRSRVAARPKRRLEVSVKAMDLRFLASPIMVGTYEQDPIAGPLALVDRELLDGDLSQRRSLGLYAGPLGTASVVLRVPNLQERQRGSLSGAVIIGLGAYDGALSVGDLTDAVRAGVLRYLLQVIDVLGKDDREVPLAALLLGYNSSANLTVSASVEALVRGVMEANAKFNETTRLNIRVSRLNLIELYQDTAITAVYALRQMPDKLAGVATRMSTMLVCRSDLEQGEGMRQRLFDGGSQSYWPRLMITDADRSDDARAPEAASDAPSAGAAAAAGGRIANERRGRTGLAERLRFLYVGQRARAESVVQQRQPGLIEALVRQQIHNSAWNEDIGRMLFQLMVPHDFKDAARQLERVVLVVDAATANLPWELMLADAPGRGDDSLPMAVRTPVVRQLASTRFRRQVRQGLERTALVVGNPSVEHFGAAFPDPRNADAADPPPLSGAEAEAAGVAAVLGGLNYRVLQAIGADQRASEVLALLYRQPYRIVHISAHGVFDLLHRDGRRRSGVVLSDGLLITAAEIAAMETVPELVYLSCCHLGQVDATVRDGNKLAASIAGELIEIGVRCVVVAGWAVDDQQALLFGETFYRHLLQHRHPFGDAVFQARRACWERRPDDITWGAFQAYGDPGWRAESRDVGAHSDNGDGRFASPEELLDALANLRADLSRKKSRQTERETRAQAQAIKQLIDKRCPPEWQALPPLQSALGAAWRDLGRYDDARTAYLKAIQANDRAGRVPIKDIEQLAHVEGQLGERDDDEALVRRALERLQQLDALVASAEAVPPAMPSTPNAERCALRGGAWKRLASVHAGQVLAPGVAPAAQRAAGDEMRRALVEAVKAYRLAEGAPGQSHFEPWLALNRLALDALTPWASDADRDAALALDQQCAKAASESFRRDAGFFNAIMQPEALLVELRLDGSLGRAGDAGTALLEKVAGAFREALSNITFKPKELDSVLSQMCLLSRFHDALGVVERAEAPKRAAEHRRMADRLIALAELLQPGSCRRDDRPGDAPPPPVKKASRAKAPARRKARQ